VEPGADASAYCDFVSGIARSESALDMAPTAFATAGVVSGADVSPGGSVLGPTARLIAGLSYSASALYRGIATRDGAEAECRRYRTVSALHAFLESYREGTTGPSLRAKLRVLDDALAPAAEMLRTARAALLESRTTVEKVHALELRVDALRSSALETREVLEAYSNAPTPPAKPVEEVMRDRDRAEAEAERYEARVRQSRAWDVSLRGGYDRIFGASPSFTPLFALVTVSVNLGGFLQPGEEERAKRGRVAWARMQVEGLDDRIEQMLARMRALLSAEEERRAQTKVLLADLEARYKELEAIPGQKVADYAQYVWFDLVRTRAEYAYLDAHVADLRDLLGMPETHG
jgi:hypothetical protein